MTSTQEYTPDTDEVRELYQIARGEADGIIDFEITGAEFDRWLKAIRAAAWDEGFDAGERDTFEHETFDEPCIENPYRTEAS